MPIRFRGRLDTRASQLVKDKLKALERPVTRADAQDIARESLSEMKALIAAGVSPVKGAGLPARFPRYKNPKRYPGRRKPVTPVNLYLTGAMLADLTARVVSSAAGFAAEIGYSTSKSKAKERGHREGANGQPIRPTIPQASSGETFATSIQQVYLKYLASAIDRLARRR